MYICPICGCEFVSEEGAAKHLLRCWREDHPYHKSKSAPRSEDNFIREVNNDVSEFFGAFGKDEICKK